MKNLKSPATWCTAGISSAAKDVPDDYEDIMEWTVSGNTEKPTIAMVNGFAVEDEKREVRLLN